MVSTKIFNIPRNADASTGARAKLSSSLWSNVVWSTGGTAGISSSFCSGTGCSSGIGGGGIEGTWGDGTEGIITPIESTAGVCAREECREGVYPSSELVLKDHMLNNKYTKQGL